MTTHVDPICSMTVDESTEFKAVVEGKLYFFCGAGCRDEFLAPAGKGVLRTYFPLILIAAYLVGGVLISELSGEAWDTERAMRHFMGGFFVVFSFFKLLNLRGLGGSVTKDLLPSEFKSAYGGDPWSGRVFLQFGGMGMWGL